MAYGNGESGTPPGVNGLGMVAGAFAKGNGLKITSEKTKSVSYSATQSDQIFSISSEASATTSGTIPNLIEVENNGNTPIFVIVGYETYSADATDEGAEYLHTMIMPGEVYSPPVRGIIATGADTLIVDGTAVDNEAPDSSMFTDSGVDINAGEGGTHVIGSTSATNLWLPEAGWTGPTNGVHLRFRVGDLIRVGNEIMEVTEVGSGADGTNNNYLTVIRGVHGSTAVDTHTNGDDIRFPFFNAYHDFDKYTVAQTDSDGKYKCFNAFGKARAATGNQGLTPGSFSCKFWLPGHQNLGLSGISATTNSGLTASGSYWLKISIDGGTAESINFTADSSDLSFGNVIRKIQTVLDEKYYNTAANIFEQRATVSIVNGDIQFRSGQRLSTSAIALTAGADGASAAYNIFAQQNGRFPALANVPDAVAAKLPDDVVYDRVTYATSPALVFGYDDGRGNLLGICGTGSKISYETGAIDMIGCPANSEFVFSFMHSTAFSGKLTEGETDRENTIKDVYVNTPSQKETGSVVLRTY